MEKELSVINKIHAIYNDLFDAEKKAADYIIQNPEKSIEMTVSELSQASEASEATIIRFCKKCGCKGFHHLKIQIAKEMMDNEQRKDSISNEINGNDIDQSLKNIMANKIQEIEETFYHINGAELKEILERIMKAKTVFFAAVGNTIPVVLDAVYKFNQIGIPSVSFTILETQLAFAHNLTKEDVLIAVSASGSSKTVIKMVEIAKKKGCKTIAITNHFQSPLANISDYLITTATREKLFFDEFSFTRISSMAVIEAIFLLLFTMKRDSYQYISEHEQSMADDKL